jgi:hypothetical protein
MKKILYTSLLFILCLTYKTNAQTWPCSPDPNLTYNGISPEVLPNAMAGYEYWSTLSFKIPRDSSISGIAITIDSAKFIYATGKPQGFDFTCNTPECVWAGGTKGCALFYGKADSTLTDSVAEYPMKIYTLTWFRFTGATDQFSRIDSATNYKFRIVKYNGISELSTYTHLTAYPNPTQGKVTIELRDIQDELNELLIVDVFGKVVFKEKLTKPNQFLTSLSFDLSEYQAGLYLVSLTSGNKTSLVKVQLR